MVQGAGQKQIDENLYTKKIYEILWKFGAPIQYKYIHVCIWFFIALSFMYEFDKL